MADTRPWPETNLASFPSLKGLNTTLAPGVIGPTALTIADNIIFGERGTWKKRGGLVQQNGSALTSSLPVKKLIDYWKAGSSGAPSQRLVAISGTKIFSSSDAGANFSDISGSISVPLDSLCAHAIVGDALVMSFAATTPMYWNQTGNVTSLAGTPPNGNVCAQHLNRCWMNEKTDPHKIYFTGVNSDGSASPSKWSIANGGGSFYIEADDGDPVGITAIFQHFDNLYIAKQKKLYAIEGRTRDTFRPVLVSNGIGCIAHNCVVPIGKDIVFPSLHGFHSLGEVAQGGDLTQFSRLSANIHTTYHTELNRGRLKHGHGAFIPELNSVVWAVPLTGQTNLTIALVYNLTNREWTRFINFKCDALVSRYNSSTNQNELFTGGNTGNIYKYTKGTLADYTSTAIEARIKSGHLYPDMKFGHKWNFKKFVALFYPQGDHDVTFNYRTDAVLDASHNVITNTLTESQGALGSYVPMGSSFIMGTNLMGESAFVQPTRFDVFAEGQSFEWEIVQGGLNEDLDMQGYYMEIDPASPQNGRQ